MSSVKKIRNGLFCVTWEKRPSPIISKPKENVPVTNVIPGYTSCYLEVRVDGESLVLDTKLVPSEENKTHETELEKVLVIATYQKAQVKMKLFKGFKWQARWNFKPNICAKCEMAKSKTQLELFELVFDFQANPLQEKTVVDDSVPFHLGRSLMNNTSLADITFKCGNQSFHAHSLIILSCCSPELISMFQAAKSQENPDVLKTSDQNITPKTRSTKVNQPSVPVKTATVIYVNLEPKMEPKAFGQLLEFIYTGQVQFNDDMNVKNLIHLAFAFKVEPLKKNVFCIWSSNYEWKMPLSFWI